MNVKIKIALSKDEVRILIKILVGDLGPSYFAGTFLFYFTSFEVKNIKKHENDGNLSVNKPGKIYLIKWGLKMISF